jgi:hypothetical protein
VTLRRIPVVAEPSDGDKGDVLVSGGGLTWLLDAAAYVPPQEPVWRWNGLDTSQFEGADAVQSAGDSGALSVVADADQPSGFLLRYAGTGTGAGVVARLATDLLPDAGSYRYELEVAAITAQYGGILFYGDLTGGPGTLYAYTLGVGAAGWGSIVNNGAITVNAGTNQAALVANQAGLLEIRVRGAKVAGGGGKFTAYAHGNRDTTAQGGTVIRSSQYGAPGAGYNALAARRFGLALQAAGGQAFGTIDLRAMRVYREAA